MPLKIYVPSNELYNRETHEFTQVKGTELTLEHSLVSLSKWESKWEIPYLTEKEKTDEQVLDYIRFMTLTKHVDPNVYLVLTVDNLKAIEEYLKKKQTATTINNTGRRSSRREIITSELIYYWMIAQNIPKDFEKWPLNRLLTLIEVCSIKNAPPKKRGFKQTQDYYESLNKARRKKFNSKG